MATGGRYSRSRGGTISHIGERSRYGAGMGILRLSHVDVKVADLDLAAAYYMEVMGLGITERVDERLFFKSWDEEDHHSLAVRYDPRTGIDRFSFKVETEERPPGISRLVPALPLDRRHNPCPAHGRSRGRTLITPGWRKVVES